MERIVYEDSHSRFRAIATGVSYGDAGDAKVQNSIDTVLKVIASGMENGRVVARQVREALDKLFEGVRADIIAEHFAREHHAGTLFGVAKELDDQAHIPDLSSEQPLTTEAKSVLGVFADFVQAKRSAILNGLAPMNPDKSPRPSDSSPIVGASTMPRSVETSKTASQEPSNESSTNDQTKLI